MMLVCTYKVCVCSAVDVIGKNDDKNGVQAIYGIASTSKPRIDTYTLGPAGITLLGAHFDATDNEVWFTDASASLGGAPVRIAHLPSSMGGTRRFR